MKIRFYNTLYNKKQDFIPLKSGKVSMYVCGPTVYDRAHIGNARSTIVFDIVYRFLSLFYQVSYVRNITDIDDKIIHKAQEKGQSISEITSSTIDFFHQDIKSLKVLSPCVEPKATDHVAEMISMISSLVNRGYAYISAKHVLFDITSYSNYGKLSKCSLEEIIAGSRVEIAPYKKNPHDFILWKPSDTNNTPGWDSPWGIGRPGWHIECSAMIKKHLGISIDIHGGGQDLIFPHHENEIAQSECNHNSKSLARYWLHNGMLMINGQKMSKSLNNIYTVAELLKQASGETIRFAILSTHYRQPLKWDDNTLKQAKKSLDSLYRALMDYDFSPHDYCQPIDSDVCLALSDDLNVPLAIARLHSIAKTIFKKTSKIEKISLQRNLYNSAQILGLLSKYPTQWFQNDNTNKNINMQKIESLIQYRMEAKNNKEFTIADKIRNDLAQQGIILEDTPKGTTWRKG